MTTRGTRFEARLEMKTRTESFKISEARTEIPN